MMMNEIVPRLAIPRIIRLAFVPRSFARERRYSTNFISYLITPPSFKGALENLMLNKGLQLRKSNFNLERWLKIFERWK